MGKQKAIQILEKLISNLEEPNFKLSIWKNDALSYMKSLFPKSFEKKEKEIKGIEPNMPTYLNPRNQEQKQHQESEIKENMLKAKDTLKTLLSNYIEEIKIKGLEESDRENTLQESLETQKAEVNKLNEELRKKEEIIEQKDAKITELEKRIPKEEFDKLNEELRKKDVKITELKKQIPKTFWQKVKKKGIGVTIVAVLVALVTWAITHYYNTGKDIGATKYEKSKYDLEVKVGTLTNENKQLKSSLDSLKKLSVDKK